jgi:acetyl esterase/lipase
MTSWLFLGVSLWGAWFTWNAYRPIYRPAPLATMSFFAGWLTSELAIHHITWQLAATFAFAWAGAFLEWPGRIGFAITVASWAALYRCYARAGEATDVMEEALVESLGPDYRRELPAALREREPEIEWQRLVMPFRMRHPEVIRVRNVEYARVGPTRLLLDVYHHRARPTGCPVLLQIHGGAWILGSKDEQGLPLMHHLAARGWVCVSINYRLSPRATFPDPIIDVKRAIAWIRAHGAEYGADPRFLVVTGGSAGGHLCALAALTGNDPEYQPGFEHVDTRVNGCVSFYGVYDFTDRHGQYRNAGLARLLQNQVMNEKASPMSRVSEDAPPFLVVHGDRDTLVPVEEARHFVAALRERTKAPVAYAEIPGAQHAFEIFPSVRTALVVDGVERFLGVLRARARAGRPAPAVASGAPVEPVSAVH